MLSFYEVGLNMITALSSMIL